MLRGLYTSAMGMNVQSQALDVVANNMANANTNGFRGATAVHQSFPELLALNLHQHPGHPAHNLYPIAGPQFPGGGPNFGVTVSGIHHNHDQGAFYQTHGELDLAIGGAGFFAVQAVNRNGELQEMFTRNGSFSINAERTLVTQGGERVLNQAGQPITLPEGEIAISQAGEISVNNEVVDTIRLVDFENYDRLRAFGYNMFTALDDANEIDFVGSVNQGFLERSNVNIVKEMVRMVNISRAYELNQRMIQIQDQTLQQAVTEIARR